MFLGGKKIIISPNLFKSKGRNINLKKKKLNWFDVWLLINEKVMLKVDLDKNK